MKTDLLDSIQYITCILGVSMANMEEILSMALLVLSIVLALINIILKLVNALKDGKLDKDEIKEITQDVEDLKDNINKKD